LGTAIEVPGVNTSGGAIVPFIDLRPSHAPIKPDLLEGIGRLIDAGAFTNGPQVAAFEQAFASFTGVHHCVGVASGLDALRLALLATEIEPGDEVIVPANTFPATVEAITQARGVPLLVDASESDYNIDPAAAAAAVSSRTRILLPVHLYGQLANVPAVRRVADRYGLVVIEDACQAHGAVRDGISPGTHTAAAAFSFFPAKNLGAMGDAGAIVTNRADVAEVVRELREHGQRAKYEHEREGWTARLDTIQALVLLHKLPLMDAWTGQRRAAAAWYLEQLRGAGDVILPPVPSGSEPVWHLFVIRTAHVQELGAYLEARGIATGRHYPKPIHLTAAFRHLGYGLGAFPVSERLAREVLSLPIYPGISDAQLEAVTDAIKAYFAGGKGASAARFDRNRLRAGRPPNAP
jgi:dTDP-4-amino-4,6-dideoxygalactose transaminase